MDKAKFKLISKLQGKVIDLPCPAEVHIPLNGLELKIGKGKPVSRGTVLADGPESGQPAIIASLAGKISAVTPTHLVIKAGKEESWVEPVDVKSMPVGEELLSTLQQMGVDASKLAKADKLIINGLNPEPGISVYDQLLRDERRVLAVGLEMARKLISPAKVILGLPEGAPDSLPEAQNFYVEPFYPSNIDQLLVKEITGQENSDNVAVLSVPNLYVLGSVILSGLPFTETIMSIKGKNYRMRIGTPVGEAFKQAEVQVKPGDQVILGGPFRGRSVYSLDQGVVCGAYGLTLLGAGAYPPVQDIPCTNCGECVRYCPARLQPNMISRYAEFNLFEKTLDYHIHSCFECGLCAYYCIAQRPMVQYIQLAKEELAKMA